jgi:hypothetical protein
MRKFLILPLFLLSVACVNEPQKAGDTVGNVRRFEPLVVTFEDNERIAAICRALSSKEDLLSVLVTTGTQYQFSYAQKNCSDRDVPTPKNVTTTIERTDSNYIFKPNNGEGFGFPDVETASKGAMAEVCANLTNLMSPMQTSRSGAIWFTTFTQSEHCQSDASGLCIHIQRGSILDDLNYQIHTNEWIKFKITNEKRGFFVERKLISSANCSNKGTLEKRATLK